MKQHHLLLEKNCLLLFYYDDYEYWQPDDDAQYHRGYGHESYLQIIKVNKKISRDK